MNFEKIKNNETQFLALTSLSSAEFDEILTAFKPRWHQAFKHFDLRGKRRKKPLTARQIAKDTTQLPGVSIKLFFILHHFKLNAIQQSEAMLFDISQPQVSLWAKLLLPILHQAIVDFHLQPARNSDDLVRLFRNRQHDDSVLSKPATTTLNADGTDRPLSRNVDQKAQKFDFSGKPKNTYD